MAGATPQDSGYGVYIGGFSIASGATYSGQYFNGLIDEASYYRRALSGAEIASLYNAGSAGKCDRPHPFLLRIQLSRNADGTTRVQFVGDNSRPYQIQVSGDMVTWAPLATCMADAEGNVEFTDAHARGQAPRFYRVVEQ